MRKLYFFTLAALLIAGITIISNPTASAQLNGAVYTGQGSFVDVIDRDGGVTHIAATGSTTQLTIKPRPQHVVTAACTSRYSDVCPDFWAYAYIECLASRSIISGYADGTFRPNNPITRGQLAKVVSNSAGFSDNPPGQTFADIPIGSTFYLFIERLAGRSIVGGYACGGPAEPCSGGSRPYFRPNANTTRAQISKIVSEAKGYNDTPSSQTFQDVVLGSTFYLWVQRLASRNAMSGYACGGAGEPCISPGNLPYFRPANNGARAQVSKIVTSSFFPQCLP